MMLVSCFWIAYLCLFLIWLFSTHSTCATDLLIEYTLMFSSLLQCTTFTYRCICYPQMVKHILNCCHCVSAHSLFIRDGKYDPDIAWCVLLEEISEDLFHAVRPFSVKEAKALNLCTLCISLENCHRDCLALSLLLWKRQLRSVFKLYIPLWVCVWLPHRPAALLPGMSLEG